MVSTDKNEDRVLAALEKHTSVLNKMARPYIVVDVYPKRSINMLYFRIRNVGSTPGFDIRIQPDIVIPFRNQESSELPIFSSSIGVMGPGEEISFFYDSAIELFDRDDPILHFSVDVQYEDSDGAAFTKRMPINIELLKGLALEIPASDKIVREIEQLHKKVEKLARSAERIVQKQMMEEWKKEQGEEATSTEGSSERPEKE